MVCIQMRAVELFPKVNTVVDVSRTISKLQAWNDPEDEPHWAEKAWNAVTGVTRLLSRGSKWSKYIDEFASKRWNTDFAKKQAAKALKRFFETASSSELANPDWSGSDELTVLNEAAHHETSSLCQQISSRFFQGFQDFTSDEVSKVGQGGAPVMTPGGGLGLVKGIADAGLAYAKGDALALSGKLIQLGVTELGPLMSSAFKKLPSSAWKAAVDKEFDVEDAHFEELERVVTKNGKMGIVKNINKFRPGVVTVTLDDGQVKDFQAAMINRSFKRGEWCWTARYEAIPGKVIISIGLIERVIKTNLFYQVRILATGLNDLYLAKHLKAMELHYQAVLDTTPMAQDFRHACLFENKVKLDPCNVNRKMEVSLANHEGREAQDQRLTRDLIMVAEANQKEYLEQQKHISMPGFGGGSFQYSDLPWAKQDPRVESNWDNVLNWFGSSLQALKPAFQQISEPQKVRFIDTGRDTGRRRLTKNLRSPETPRTQPRTGGITQTSVRASPPTGGAWNTEPSQSSISHSKRAAPEAFENTTAEELQKRSFGPKPACDPVSKPLISDPKAGMFAIGALILIFILVMYC